MKSNYLLKQRNYPLPRTAIEAEILFAACVKHLRFLKRSSGKTPLKETSSGKKIGAESAVLHFVFFIVIVNKMQQSAKESCSLKRNTVPEVFPLTAGIAGSGKTMPFEKRRSRYKETAENKAEAYRVYVEHLFSACDAVDARIFSKGDGNMTRKMSTTNLSGARGNAYPNAELDYSLDYEYDSVYAHRLVHAGNRYYRYDANGNITAEKDGPFTEDDEFIFTYNYDPDTDVYGTDYGFGLDAPNETEETHPENLFAYRRNYTWNEKNLLTKSSDRSYTVHYRYGEDGQRALKYTEEGRSETLYFNNFYTIHIPVQDKNNPQGLRVHKHIFVGNSRLVTAMTHTDNNGDNAEQREKRYYSHSDHLGSAQFVTDWRGRQYEHIEYTPYGELWIEEVAAGLDKLPFRFTGKEMDEETGLYYYGARYLDPKYSRWLSGDPALSDYIPKAPIDDEAKKHNENLPGMGGVFNVVNLHLYHYAGNNPVKYTDPDGKAEELGSDSSDHLLVRRTDDGKHIIVDGGNKYNYVEQALINYINTEDERYLNQVPETSDPLAVAGISAFIADYLDNNDTNSNSIGSKSETIFAIAIAVAGSSGGNRDAHTRPFASTKEATAAAAKLGFSKTNYFSEREPVYKKGHLYITPDRTSHNGGVWKMAGSVEGLKQRSTRMGTYDANLNRIGD